MCFHTLGGEGGPGGAEKIHTFYFFFKASLIQSKGLYSICSFSSPNDFPSHIQIKSNIYIFCRKFRYVITRMITIRSINTATLLVLIKQLYGNDQAFSQFTLNHKNIFSSIVSPSSISGSSIQRCRCCSDWQCHLGSIISIPSS